MEICYGNMENIKMELDSAIDNQQWKEARDILHRNRDLLKQKLTENHDFLHHAFIHGAPADIITQLISPHNINMQDEDNETAVHWAVREKRWELVSVLLQHGANVNLCDLKDRWNQTPLLLAVHQDAPTDIAAQLISPHNINMQDKDCNTALHEAVRLERWELVLFLLQHGADVNLCDWRNLTPLHLAVYYGAPADIITQLISPHNINLQDRFSYTALIDAVREDRWELVPVLLQHGADPSVLEFPQPNNALMRSLKALCITTIRSHMPVKSDEAYEGLGLPGKLVAEVKLRPQAEDIVKRGQWEKRLLSKDDVA